MIASLLLSGLLALQDGSAAAGPAAAAKERDDTPDVVVDAPTQKLIDGAMNYLDLQQNADGSWTGNGTAHKAAFTGYVLIAYMAAGHGPQEGPHAANIRRGMEFLLSCSRADGYLALPPGGQGENNMYGHGIATIALGEMLGQSDDPRLRDAVKRAVTLIVSAQEPRSGGWRYQPIPQDHDLSVSVLQLVALRVASEAGIAVPAKTIQKGIAYVKSCRDNGSGGFNYRPGDNKPGFARTAAAIYSLQVCGLYEDPMLPPASDYLFANYQQDREWYTYGNFYAGPAQYMLGGDRWRRWYASVNRELTTAAQTDGTTTWWKPIGRGGQNDIFATACYSMILSLPLGYIPVYQR